jgi:hypothetical protein
VRESTVLEIAAEIQDGRLKLLPGTCDVSPGRRTALGHPGHGRPSTNRRPPPRALGDLFGATFARSGPICRPFSSVLLLLGWMDIFGMSPLGLVVLSADG